MDQKNSHYEVKDIKKGLPSILSEALELEKKYNREKIPLSPNHRSNYYFLKKRLAAI